MTKKVYYEIYIDSVFIMNFVMNLTLLYFVSRRLYRSATRLSIFFGSILSAALFCLILILPGIPYFWKVVTGLIPVNMIIVKITFRIKKWKQLYRAMSYIYLSAFLLGGIILFLQKRITFLRERSQEMWGVIGCVCLAFMIGEYLTGKYGGKESSTYYQVHIPYGDELITVTALADTGNQLAEPISGKPVSLLDQNIWDKIGSLKKEEKFKVIPYHSVGKKNGMLEGYELECIIIEDQLQQLECRNVILAVCTESISSEGKYQMILHPDLLKRNMII